jgi:hypothetical protein
LKLLLVHFGLADEFLDSQVVDDRNEEEGRAMRGEADGRVNSEEEDRHSRVPGAVNSHQLEVVVIVAVEDCANDVTHFI